jgi:hypothetical protein
MRDDFQGLAAPAKRALAGAGIESLQALSRRTEAEVAALHAMGPNALRILREKLAAAGLAFRA